MSSVNESSGDCLVVAVGWFLIAVQANKLCKLLSSKIESGSGQLRGKKFVPFSYETLQQTIVLDSTHSYSYRPAHLLKDENQKNLTKIALFGDSITDSVLNAIATHDERFLSCQYVCSKHFGIDSFLAVWSSANPSLALKHQNIIRECAKIGDIRELELRREDKWRDIALRVVCWLNAVEKERFRHLENAVSSPEEHDKLEMAKFTYFLDHFSFALLHIHAPVLALVYAEEYERVLEEYEFLRSGKRRCRPNGGGGSSSLPDPHTPPGMQPNPVLKVFSPAKNRAARLHGAPSHTQHPEVGLVVVRAPDPLHYYSLFSLSKGFDIVLSCYSGCRYELELKYTTYVELASRGTLPRVELQQLACLLNQLELQYTAPCYSKKLFGSARCSPDDSVQTDCSVSTSSDDEDMVVRSPAPLSLVRPGRGVLAEKPGVWICDPITHPRPLLRLEPAGPGAAPLSEAQRTANPFERPIRRSNIPATELERVVVSYFNFAFRSTRTEPREHWLWSEVHAFNRSVDWSKWEL